MRNRSNVKRAEATTFDRHPDFGMHRDQSALDRFTSTPSFEAFQSALKGSKPVQPPAAEWLDIVDASYEIF